MCRQSCRFGSFVHEPHDRNAPYAGISGAPGWNRTSDTRSRKPVLPLILLPGASRCRAAESPEGFASCNPPATARSVTGWRSIAPGGSRAHSSTRETAPGGTQRHCLALTLLPSHGGNTGSNPVCATTFFRRRCRGFVHFAPAEEGLQKPACNPPATESGGRRWHGAVLGGTRSANARALRLIPAEGVRGRLHGQITRRG